MMRWKFNCFRILIRFRVVYLRDTGVVWLRFNMGIRLFFSLACFLSYGLSFLDLLRDFLLETSDSISQYHVFLHVGFWIVLLRLFLSGNGCFLQRNLEIAVLILSLRISFKQFPIRINSLSGGISHLIWKAMFWKSIWSFDPLHLLKLL